MALQSQSSKLFVFFLMNEQFGFYLHFTNIFFKTNASLDINNIMEKQFECTKIKDGLYLGNKLVAYDLEFLVINKFAYVINCTTDIPNIFEQHGIKYLKFKIPNDKNHKILDENGKRLKKMKKFVTQAQQNGVCCLVHSSHGSNRSLGIIIIYLMERFQWRLKKTIQYIKSKQIFVDLLENTIQELAAFEYFLSKDVKLSHLWTGPYIDQQQQLISKTFLNTLKHIEQKVLQNDPKQIKNDRRVKWQDRIEKQLKKQKKRLLAEKNKEIQTEKIEQKEKDGKKNQLMKKQKRVDKKMQSLSFEKQRQDLLKKSKKRIEQSKKKVDDQQMLKLFKKPNQKQKKQEVLLEDPKINFINDEMKTHSDDEQQKKIYKLTINNYINPNINIIKPPLQKKNKLKPQIKKQKDKFNRTYSQKQAFKRVTLYEKQAKEKIEIKDKRNAGSTPLRGRKERKSEKQKQMKF